MKFIEELRLYFNMIKFHRIKNAFSILKKEGWAGIKYHFYLVKDKEKGLKTKCIKEYTVFPFQEYKDIDSYEKVMFKTYQKPIVSIIIPVFNQFAYTYNCLRALKNCEGEEEFEIILADDCSTDLTIDIDKIVEGINVLHNKDNLQFLKNCNNASQKVRGKYIVFLNNDTQVQSNWLKALIELMEADESIGLAGSKLVYPNGFIQEAGGIVWSDGSVLQYGNGRQSGEDDLNIKRETDYISGASIIITRNLWEKIGGFDERFAPAYYEDVDLAFEVRKKGYKVVYQPESEVVHFEGVSELKDASRKDIINRNREKFIVKWKKILYKDFISFENYSKYCNNKTKKI